MQVVLVYLQYISTKIHYACVAAENREQFTLNPYFGGSRSFKVIDVGTPGKLVSSACYDMEQVCLSATVLVLG